MLQIIYTTVFQVKQLNNLTLHVRLFNSLTRKYYMSTHLAKVDTLNDCILLCFQIKSFFYYCYHIVGNPQLITLLLISTHYP
jgi:hypothetical protein